MRRLLLPLIVLLAVVAPVSPAAAQGQPDRPQHGAEAVRALGDRIAAVARAHGTSVEVLRERFMTDDTLWVDVRDRLFYVDPPAPQQVEAATGTTTAGDPAGALTLHSRPGAQRTLLLDFDGVGPAYGGTIGSAWEPGYTGGDGNAEPYDTAGDRTAAFTTTELQEIRSIWERVSEDYAPFDVDVTTQEPTDPEVINRSGPSDAVFGTRVAMTSSTTSCGCGGVAYVGVFDLDTDHAKHQPAFVYNEGAKAAAEAASHEAGHTLGLSHDGTRTTGYYQGQGDWAPIMGVGYYEPISQWSKGEYSGANNKEDDFGVAQANGAPLAGDEGPMTLPDTATATIGTDLDSDDFTFTLGQPQTVSLTVTPAATSPNLDVKATLLQGSTVLTSSDPLSSTVSVDVASGLDATVTRSLAAGTYTLRVEGVGARDPLTTGYSGYGSVGRYGVAMTTTAPAAGPDAPTSVSATASSTGSVAVSWTSVRGATGYRVLRETMSGTTVTGSTLVGTPTGTSYADKPSTGTYRYVVQAVNEAGTSAGTASGTVTVKAKGNR